MCNQPKNSNSTEQISTRVVSITALVVACTIAIAAVVVPTVVAFWVLNGSAESIDCRVAICCVICVTVICVCALVCAAAIVVRICVARGKNDGAANASKALESTYEKILSSKRRKKKVPAQSGETGGAQSQNGQK